MVNREQHICAEDQARRIFCESPFLVDHDDCDGEDRQCCFRAEEGGEPSAIQNRLQDRIDFSGRSADHVQSGQQSVHEGEKEDRDDDAPRPGIVDIDIRPFVRFPPPAAFSPSLPAEQKFPERRLASSIRSGSPVGKSLACLWIAVEFLIHAQAGFIGADGMGV